MTRKADKGVVRGDPSRTRALILSAALKEFSENGLGGARIEAIAGNAGVNKQALYYHFGSKEKLYQATLEYGYESLRILDKEAISGTSGPAERMRALVGYFFDTMAGNRPVVWLVSEENRLRGRNLPLSPRIRNFTANFVSLIREIYDEGVEQKIFRPGIDPEQLWITIVSVSYLYFGNIYTLSYIINKNLDDPKMLKARRDHIVDIVLLGIERR